MTFAPSRVARICREDRRALAVYDAESSLRAGYRGPEFASLDQIGCRLARYGAGQPLVENHFPLSAQQYRLHSGRGSDSAFGWWHHHAAAICGYPGVPGKSC